MQEIVCKSCFRNKRLRRRFFIAMHMKKRSGRSALLSFVLIFVQKFLYFLVELYTVLLYTVQRIRKY